MNGTDPKVKKPSPLREVVHSRKARWYHIILAIILGPIWFLATVNGPTFSITTVHVFVYYGLPILVFLGLSALIERGLNKYFG